MGSYAVATSPAGALGYCAKRPVFFPDRSPPRDKSVDGAAAGTEGENALPALQDLAQGFEMPLHSVRSHSWLLLARSSCRDSSGSGVSGAPQMQPHVPNGVEQSCWAPVSQP